MDKNMINPIDGMAVETKTSELPAARNGMTLMDILERMDKIIAQGAELANVVQQIKDLPGDMVGKCRADDLADIYKSRETTNQKMLAMLDKMYDDMMGKQATASEADKVIEAISKINFAGISHQTAAVIMDRLMGNNPA